MKPLFRLLPLVLAFAIVVPPTSAAEPRRGEPGGPGEYQDFKVLKAYSAKDGEYVFHAFAIEWEG